jgi:hypothetical protein
MAFAEYALADFWGFDQILVLNQIEEGGGSNACV